MVIVVQVDWEVVVVVQIIDKVQVGINTVNIDVEKRGANFAKVEAQVLKIANYAVQTVVQKNHLNFI